MRSHKNPQKQSGRRLFSLRTLPDAASGTNFVVFLRRCDFKKEKLGHKLSLESQKAGCRGNSSVETSWLRWLLELPAVPPQPFSAPWRAGVLFPADSEENGAASPRVLPDEFAVIEAAQR